MLLKEASYTPKALFTLVRFCFKTVFPLHFRNDLHLHYTTENAFHVTIHAGTTIDM